MTAPNPLVYNEFLDDAPGDYLVLVEGQARIGGPLPEFWVWLTLTVLLAPALFAGWLTVGVPGLVLAMAGYLVATVVAERVMR